MGTGVSASEIRLFVVATEHPPIIVETTPARVILRIALFPLSTT